MCDIIIICEHFWTNTNSKFVMLPNWLELWNTPTASLQRGKIPTSNEYLGYDTRQSDLGMQSTPSLSLLPGSLWPGVGASDRVLSMGQIGLNCILMLNWIAWNRTVLTFKLCTYSKLNCLKWNCFCMLNWIIWNATVFDIEIVLMLNWIVWNRTVYLYKNEFGIK